MTVDCTAALLQSIVLKSLQPTLLMNTRNPRQENKLNRTEPNREQNQTKPNRTEFFLPDPRAGGGTIVGPVVGGLVVGGAGVPVIE